MVENVVKCIGNRSSSLMVLHCDNEAVILVALNLVYHEQTEHIEVDCHFIKEKVAQIHIKYTRLNDRA